MKNLLAEPIRVSKNEQRVADFIAKFIVIILAIIAYTIKLIFKLLNKFKKQLYKATLVVAITYGLTCFFMPMASAPKANASTPYSYVNDYQPTEGWDGFVKAVHTIAPMYNYPENVILAQGALESQRGNSKFAKERNNFLGIGAFDSNPDNALAFDNAEQCVIAYMQLVKKNFPDAWANREDSDKLLKLLEDNSRGNYYASDPNYVSKVESMKEWSN